MTKQQYERWFDFAGRMATHGWPQATAARKQKVLEAVLSFIDQYDNSYADVEGWDGSAAGVYVCDELSDFFSTWGVHLREDCEQTKFERQVSCCVRAGLDVASEPSAGVVGFDVGMLRRMYDGEIPEWLATWFTPPLSATDPDEYRVWL